MADTAGLSCCRRVAEELPAFWMALSQGGSVQPLLAFVPIHVRRQHPTGGEIGESAVDAVPEALQAV